MNKDCYWFIFCKTELVLEKQDDGSYTIPKGKTPPVEAKPWTTIHNITPFEDGTAVKTFRIDAPLTEDDRYEMCGLRKSYNKIPYDLYLKAGKCQEILYWDFNTKFCGVCGAPMKLHTDISKRCTNCGKEVWPQLATAIIVLIRKDDEVLLVHARNFQGDFYGLVAVIREVHEETGLEIKNIRYFGSQPWPYPCGLMVGFNAEYVSGEIHLQRSELSSGKWFKKDNLPHIPEKLSIARKLLDHWLEESNP